MTKAIDLPTLIDQYHDEDACRALLEKLRWPNGPVCIRCGSVEPTPVKGRPTYDCQSCHYHFSVRAGTVLQDSKLPLWKWFLGTFLMIEAKKGVSSNQLKRMLGLSYKSSWFLSHRIRAAMGSVAQDQLRGVIEADETFVGGKYRYARTDRRPDGRLVKGPRPDSNKTIVLGAVERGGQVRLRVAPNRGKRAIEDFLVAEVADEAEALYTDDWDPYKNTIADKDTVHETVNHSEKEWVRGDVHTNTIEGVWSLLKRSIIGSFHHISVKHLPVYLDEIEWRFNNRDNPDLFRDTLRALVSADELTYEELIED
jgi:transposase-like protein